MFSMICARAFFRQTRLMDCLEEAEGGDGQTVLNFAGTGTTKFLGSWFEEKTHILGGLASQYFWLDCFAMGGDDGQTVLNLAGTVTTKFLGGLFLGVNSYIFGPLQW